MNVNMTKEFSSTLLEMQRGRNLLITGHTGTGKSTLLCTFINEYSRGRNCLIIAPTEDAASKVGGITIGEVFGFSQSEPVNTTGPYHQTPNQEYTEVLESLDVLIIDEISMVRADHFDMINTALKRTKRNSNPFGGVQLIIAGHILQRPPTLRGNELEFFTGYPWNSPYFFSAHCYPLLELYKIELTTTWQQKNNDSIDDIHPIYSELNVCTNITENTHILDSTIQDEDNNEKTLDHLSYLKYAHHQPISTAVHNKVMDTLFGHLGKSFSRTSPLITSESIEQLLHGPSAWICRDRIDFLDRISQGSNPFKIEKQSNKGYFTKTIISLILWFAAFTIINSSPTMKYGTLIIASEAFFIIYTPLTFIYALYTISRMDKCPEWNIRKSLAKIERELGGPVDEKLAIFYIDINCISPLHQDILRSMQWLYADASINNMPLSPKQWRELTTAALQSADIYLQTGDIEPARILGEQIKVFRPYGGHFG